MHSLEYKRACTSFARHSIDDINSIATREIYPIMIAEFYDNHLTSNTVERSVPNGVVRCVQYCIRAHKVKPGFVERRSRLRGLVGVCRS